IDGMVLAVVDDDAHVLQREAGDRSGREHLLDALLHRADELVRDRPASDLVDELEPRSARQRLDAQLHLAELPRAPGLPLVAMMAFGLCGDGLAIRDPRRARIDLELELRGHAFEHRAQMQLSQAT